MGGRINRRLVWDNYRLLRDKQGETEEKVCFLYKIITTIHSQAPLCYKFTAYFGQKPLKSTHNYASRCLKEMFLALISSYVKWHGSNCKYNQPIFTLLSIVVYKQTSFVTCKSWFVCKYCDEKSQIHSLL